jgi:hypothetical protein
VIIALSIVGRIWRFGDLVGGCGRTAEITQLTEQVGGGLTIAGNQYVLCSVP